MAVNILYKVKKDKEIYRERENLSIIEIRVELKRKERLLFLSKRRTMKEGG